MKKPGASCGRLHITIGIASTGRPAILHRTLDYLAGLADAPAQVILSIAEPNDFDQDAIADPPFRMDVLCGSKGSSIQRNRILDAATDSDLVLFIDDDFLIADGYVSALSDLFESDDRIVAATGRLLADGIRGPGISHDDGLALLQGCAASATLRPRDIYSGYGCNMTVRVATLAEHRARFDESMPLYAWLEDMDLSRRLARFGRIVEDDSLVGVHLGTKTGRSAGLSLGYSQIANPVYLARKGSVQRGPLLRLAARNLAANLGKSLWPEPWIDRRGRLRGNIVALFDLLRGRISPHRILDLAGNGSGPATSANRPRR